MTIEKIAAEWDNGRQGSARSISIPRVLAMKDAMLTDCATTKADPSASTLSGQGAAKKSLVAAMPSKDGPMEHVQETIWNNKLL